VLLDALRKYHSVNAALPKYIVIYRDGVGDGQILTVREHEVSQVKESIRAATSEWVIYETELVSHWLFFHKYSNPVIRIGPDFI